MKNKKWIVAGLILSGSLGIGCSTTGRKSGNQSASWTDSSRTSSSSSSSQSMSSGIIRTAAADTSQQKSEGKISESDMHKVEQALKAKGYDPGTSGQLDSQTQQALREFQKKNNLSATGTVDQATADSLGVVIVITP